MKATDEDEELRAITLVLKLNLGVRAQLVIWLKDHETDIALEMNDFGCLQGVFKALFQRPARNLT